MSAPFLDRPSVSPAERHVSSAAVIRAHMLGHEQAAHLLQQTLQEEAAADKKLAAIAESAVNQQAARH